MNTSEKSIIEGKIKTLQGYIKTQMRMKKSLRDQRKINDAKNKCAVLKRWFKEN